MQFWNHMLAEVQFKSGSPSLLLSHENFTTAGNGFFLKNFDALKNTKETRDLRTYYLGDTFPNVYLTKREAECVFWLVQSRTIAEAAAKMALSARTIEFYIKNLKAKLKCHNKKTLLEKLLKTTLLKQLEKDGLTLVKH